MANLIARVKFKREKSADVVYTAVDGDREKNENETPGDVGDDAGDNKAIRPVPGWPNEPRTLERTSWLMLLGDLCLVLLPLPFIGTVPLHGSPQTSAAKLTEKIVLAIAAWNLNGHEFSGQGRLVLRAMQLGPTLYPLLFAGVGGRCLKNIGRKRAEVGTRLEVSRF